MTSRHRRLAGALALACAALALAAGCVDRRIRVTSEPPGARVWVNDVDLGRTPAETGFTFYGPYEIRLELEGHEPVTETRRAEAPLHEQPGLDLVAEALPFSFDTVIEWHVDLEPALDARPTTPEELAAFEAALVRRALETAEELEDDR